MCVMNVKCLKFVRNKNIMKYHFYKRWNTLHYPFDNRDKMYSFNLLPQLEFYYETAGFFTLGLNDNEYCKQLSINFDFLVFSFTLTFWWDFYIIDDAKGNL